MTTETLDKLYLEWANFTDARNAREIAAKQIAQACLDRLAGMPETSDTLRLQMDLRNLIGRLE